MRNLFSKLGGIFLSALLIAGIGVASNTTAQAQGRTGRRIVIVRPYYPYRIYRPYNPFGWYGYRRPFGYPYGWDSYYSQYVFDNGEAAFSQGYHDGLKTGRDDGKKNKSYSPERSHYFHDAGFGNYAEAYRSGFSRGYADGYNQQAG
ncbi:MAG TPA: hypothetical protein VKB86_05655 [Pyrinomonadaceae bacterium]|nr:hypothetical protein [Pyrinomonadaceae bacterium]